MTKFIVRRSSYDGDVPDDAPIEGAQLEQLRYEYTETCNSTSAANRVVNRIGVTNNPGTHTGVPYGDSLKSTVARQKGEVVTVEAVFTDWVIDFPSLAHMLRALRNSKRDFIMFYNPGYSLPIIHLRDVYYSDDEILRDMTKILEGEE